MSTAQPTANGSDDGRDDGTVDIRFSREDVATFRQWQAEQRAKLRERESADREDWESDPDAWKGE